MILISNIKGLSVSDVLLNANNIWPNANDIMTTMICPQRLLCSEALKQGGQEIFLNTHTGYSTSTVKLHSHCCRSQNFVTCCFPVLKSAFLETHSHKHRTLFIG